MPVLSRALRALFALVVLAGLSLMATPAQASTAPLRVEASSVVSVSALGADCEVETDAANCDIDRDRIPDVVEQVVAGSLTGATGTEDHDGDGIPSWTEVLACDTVTCADPRADADDDGIPNYAEQLVCGSDTCSNSKEDADGDNVSDWIEFVICGDRTCATGLEDYDANGVADAAELQACVKDTTGLALTGFGIAGILAVIAAALVGLGVLLRIRRRNAAAAVVAGDAELVGSNL
jgi:hypothetical protein